MSRCITFLFILWVCVVVFGFRRVPLKSYNRWTNIKCEALDKPFADFRHCNLKVVQRGIVALNLHAELYQVPVPNVTVNLSLLKKFYIYRPFLYNYTFDYCKLMAKPPQLSFVTIFFEMFATNSNMNHTCPYDHDIVVKNMTLRDEYFALLPLPKGEYMFNVRVAAYNDWKADVKGYFTLNT